MKRGLHWAIDQNALNFLNDLRTFFHSLVKIVFVEICLFSNSWLFDTPLIYFFSTSSSQPKPILQQPTSISPSKSAKKKKKGKDSATSSEEERWLDAIESGKLEEVGLFIIVQVYF